MIKRIVIFDFDGTLCQSPLPSDEARSIWSNHHGRPWPHKGQGWWSKLESLCVDAFKPQLIEHVKDAVIESVNDPETFTVLLTGRIPMFSKTVKEILRTNGVPYLDRYYFNDSHNTLSFKLRVMSELKAEFQMAEEMVLWEDRIEHIDPHFKEWGKLNYGDKFTLQIVEGA